MALRRPFAVLVWCVLTTASPFLPVAVAADRKILIIQGRALDQDRFPLGDVKIAADGSRNHSTHSDRRGEFSLELNLPDAGSLRKKPFEVRISPRRSGWILALPQGDPVIGLQIATVRDADGVERVVARSNHPRVAAAAARAVGSSGEVRALAAVSFLGFPGRAGKKKPPVPVLSQVAKVALNGTSGVELESVAGGAPAPWSDEATQAPEASAPVAPIVAAPEMARPSVAPDPTLLASRTPEIDPLPPSAAPPPPPPAARATARPGAPETPRDRARREWIERTIALERIRSNVRAGEVPREGTVDPTPVATTPASETLIPVPPPPSHDTPKPTTSTVGSGAADASSRPAPPVARLKALAGAPPTPSRRAPENERRDRAYVDKAKRVPVPRPYALPVSPVPAPAEPKPIASLPWAPLSAAVPPGSRPRGASGGAITGSVDPRASRGPRAMRIGSEGGGGSSRSCTCRIEGTIELESSASAGRSRPVRAVVASSGYPAIADTVTLPLGRSRWFQLGPVPCGAQRVEVRGLGRSLRVATDPEERSFRCEGGTVRRLRLVVTPR